MAPFAGKPLDGKAVIVTGASSGIGEAAARRLASEGMRVTLAARREDELERVAEAIRQAGGQALVVRTDVRERCEIDRLVESSLGHWGQIDVLVNNAGLSHDRTLARMEPERVRDEVAINLLGVIEMAQAVLPSMYARRSGHIINVASLAGLVGLPTASVYSATKFGVVGFSEALGREVRHRGIHVTALCPGFVATPFSADLKAIAEGRRPEHPRPFTMRVDDVAAHIAGLIRRPRRRSVIPAGFGFLVAAARAYPWLVDIALARLR